MKIIYFAGGCFWGMQAYFDNIQGVLSTSVGYANGNSNNPTYDMVCRGDSGFAETIQVQYDAKVVSLPFLLSMYFDVIDPTSFHRQGGDVGSQYRTGIYYKEDNEQAIIQLALDTLAKQHVKKVVVENEKLRNFYPAEAYHQEYLKKNPNGYCHISHQTIEGAKEAKEARYTKPQEET